MIADEMTADQMLEHLFGGAEDESKPLAEIIYGEEENDNGHEIECIFARCYATNCTVGPIWGQHQQSLRRACLPLMKSVAVARCTVPIHAQLIPCGLDFLWMNHTHANCLCGSAALCAAASRR